MKTETSIEETLQSANEKGGAAKFFAYVRLSGPGWMQGAITLGGGSLAGALYLGVIAGYGLLWLQPLAMLCGIIMLSAIAYVTLSTGKPPFRLVNSHLSPLLGWAWLIATMMANMVWSMPQFNLARASIQQNLLPFVGDSTLSTVIICLFVLALAFVVNILYETGSRGRQLFDTVIKLMVALIILSFILVVVTIGTTGKVSLLAIISNLVPDFSLLFKPAAVYEGIIQASSQPEWWTNRIINEQRDIIITAFGTAVGINMTWLLPYTLLKKRWGKLHRGFSIFDLSIGLFIPFLIATSCVVIASATQFHGQTSDVPPGAGDSTIAALASAHPDEMTNEADEALALMLVRRDNFQLANALDPLAGQVVSQTIFGLGVFGMAVSSIIILMLMNGLVFQELFGRLGSKTAHYVGCSVVGVSGFLGPFIWTGAAAAALAIPTSVIGGSLIPIAYFTFLLMMNSKKVLGDARPRGSARVIWNVLMTFATSVATFGVIWVLSGRANFVDWRGIISSVGILLLVILFIVGAISFIKNERKP